MANNNTLVTRLLLESGQFDSTLLNSTRQIRNFDNNVRSIGKSISNSLTGMAASMGITFAAFQGFKDAIQTNIQFEKSISSLKSLTGLAGKDLEYLTQQAIKLGATTTQSASQVAEAFKLIGSKQPELLKSKEALAAVTKYAIVLAEAAGIAVPEAATALTGALNQMGVGASKASEYINVLAAASQKGAADIPYLNTAIENCGGTAATLGISFTQMVSAIEAIAPKFTDAGAAGTYLRNIFLKLEASSDKNLKPSVVGLDKAIENLSKKGWDATKMTKEFGLINVTAAMALVNAKDAYKGFTTELEGTNTAFEQQKINTDNVSGAIDSLKSAWEGMILSMQNSNGILKSTIGLLTKAVQLTGNFFSPFDAGKDKLAEQQRKKYDELIKSKTQEYVRLGMSEKVAATRATNDVIKQIEKDTFAAQSRADKKRRNSSSPANDRVYLEYEKGKTIYSPLERGMLKGMVTNEETLANDVALMGVLPELASEYKALQEPINGTTEAIKKQNTELDKSKKKLLKYISRT